jgi:hypothetical protein
MQRAERLPPQVVPESAFRAELTADGFPKLLAVGQTLMISVKIRNLSDVIWPATDQSGLMLGNRWLDDAGEIITMIDGRAPIPELGPGDEASLSLPVVAPHHPGIVQLAVDLVEEGSRWFRSPENAPFRATLRILDLTSETRGQSASSVLLAELTTARATAATLQAHLENQGKALSAYQTSTSWRLTRPLRWIKRLVVRVRH